MAYTEKTSVGWFERLGSSFRGIGFGIVLIIAGTALLWWNEVNFVATGDALNEARALTQELGDINRLDPSKNGQLVHATGPVITKDILVDPVFGLSVNAVRLERTVEYFQWVEESKTETRKKIGGGEEKVTTYTYAKKWVREPVDSSKFKDPAAPKAHRNFALATIEDFKTQAADVTLGAYRLPDALISSISGATPLGVIMSEEARAALNKQLVQAARQELRRDVPQSVSDAVRMGLDAAVDETVGIPSQSAKKRSQQRAEAASRAPEKDAEMVHISGNTVMLSLSPAGSQIGDVRVAFKETRPGIVSLLAKCNGDTFEAYRASNGKTFSELSMGTHSLENMYGDAHSSNASMTWVLRVAGTLLVILGLKMLVAPLVVVADVIPLLGSIVGAGTGLVSTLLGLAWALVIIAVAWLRFRPLMGAAMLAVAGGLIALLYIRGRSRKAAAAQADSAGR